MAVYLGPIWPELEVNDADGICEGWKIWLIESLFNEYIPPDMMLVSHEFKEMFYRDILSKPTIT